MQQKEEWTEVITAKSNLLDLKLREIWNYRDLIIIFVRRNFVAGYKQTILGPLWQFIGPIMGAIINVTLFNNIAGISTEGTPPILFQMLSVSLWSYFLGCFSGTANVFKGNAGIFSKVYFPRLTVPISTSISGLIGLGIRFIIFICMWVYFYFQGEVSFQGIQFLWLFVLLCMLALLGMSLGVVAASITLKYKDFNSFVSYGMQFLFYLSAVVYPVSTLPDNYRFLSEYNPIVPILEAGRNVILGVGTFDPIALLFSALFIVVFSIPALMIFNYTERTFIDKV